MLRAVAAVLVLSAVLVVPVGQAAGTDPAIVRLSLDPLPGDYTLNLRVDNFRLAGTNITGPDVGYLHYLLNGHPCTAECAAGQPFRSNATRFTFHGVAVGDNLTAELRYSNGTAVLAPTGENGTMQPVRHTVAVSSRGARCIEQDQNGACTRWEGLGPFLAVASGVPNAGDYTLSLRVERFRLVPPGAEVHADDTAETGHIRYTLNSAPCEAACSAEGPSATDRTTFTFHGVRVGDRLGAELVRPDGTSLAPRVSTVVVVAQPALRIVSGVAQEGEYTMRLNVTGFSLQAPGSPANAGTGHIVYMVKRQDEAEFRRAACDDPTQTASLSYKFCGLREGDQVTAELVSSSGEPLDPPARAPPMEVKRRPEEGLAPGVGPVVAFLLLGLAALRRRAA